MVNRIKKYKRFVRVNDNTILFPNRLTTDFQIGQKIILLPENNTYAISKITCFQIGLFDDIGKGVYLELNKE